MANLFVLFAKAPLQTLIFIYYFTLQLLLLTLRRVLLPRLHKYQSYRTQIHKAYLSSAGLYPDLLHGLPVNCSVEDARKIVSDSCNAYIIPGTSVLPTPGQQSTSLRKVVILYAHGGGYAWGEARMYIHHMKRWRARARQDRIDLVFVSVEYPLSTESAHPTQRNAFVATYRYLLDQGVNPSQIMFMGDSAGGGLSVLSALEIQRLGLPQPAGSVLISPWLDLGMRAYEGGNALAETDFVDANTVVPLFSKMFIGNSGWKGTSPEINPLHRDVGEVRELNPQLILVGGAEFALQDSKDWASLLEKAGARYKLVVEWGEIHCYAIGSALGDPKTRIKTDKTVMEWIKDCTRTVLK